MSKWEAGKLTPVYNQVGNAANGEKRYVRANYDLLSWSPTGAGAPTTFVVPLGFTRVQSADAQVQLNDNEDAFAIGREFGFYDLSIQVLEQHQANGLSDSWFALHGFGPI